MRVETSPMSKREKFVYELNGQGGRPHINDLFVSFDGNFNSNNTSWDGTLTLADTEGAAEDFFILVGSGMIVTLQFGYAGRLDDPVGSMTIRGLLLEALHRYDDAGVVMTLKMVSTSIDRDVRTSYKGAWAERTKTASQIFAEVAEGVHWNAVIAPDSEVLPCAVHYDTADKETPGNWVLNTLVAHARMVESKKSIPFVFYVVPGKFAYDTQSVYGDEYHFHPQGWRPGTGFGISPVAEFVYRAGDGEVLSMQFTDASMAAAIAGAYTADTATTDSYNGTPSTVRSLSSAPIDLSDAGVSTLEPPAPSPHPDYQSDVPGIVNEVVRRRKYVVANSPEDAYARIAAKQQSLINGMYEVHLAVVGTNIAMVGDYISLKRYTSKGVLHNVVSGTYFILALRHSVSREGWTTHIEAAKSGLSRYDDVAAPAPKPTTVDTAPKLPAAVAEKLLNAVRKDIETSIVTTAPAAGMENSLRLLRRRR